MRLTSVAITFIFFGTVLATPIYSLRGNAVELSKRADPEASMPDLTGGGDGEPPNSPTSRPGTPSSPARGRGMRRGRGTSVSSVKQGKTRVEALAAESDTETTTKTAHGSSKRTKSQSQSRSPSKARRLTMLNQAQFDEAMRNIRPGKTVGGSGSQSLGVYPIEGEVLGQAAVVKIIDNRISATKIRGEVARDRKADILLGWGWKAGKEPLAYLVLKNLGVHVSKVDGLDMNQQEDREFADRKKQEALTHHETEYGLRHTDAEGDGNFLWKHNPQGATKDEQYHVTPVDWEGAEIVSGGKPSPPKALVVAPGTYAPTESQKTSDKASTEGSGGEKTPPEKKSPNRGVTGTRRGTRSQTRAEGSGTQ